MKLLDTDLPEVKRIQLDVFRDSRGFFCERYHAEKFAALGFHETFVQVNHSRSAPGVIRGLHFQHMPMQGKLVGVTSGAILDVAVDIRPGSPNFGKHVAVELSDENFELLWIPPGFAHGFCVLGERMADVVYNLTSPYNPKGENGIRLDDPAIGIRWPVAMGTAILSERDLKQPSLAEATENLKRWFV